jgi:hypothetical protein
MSITPNEDRPITAQQLRDAVAEAIRFSNAQDVRARSNPVKTPGQRILGRWTSFSTALAMGLDKLAPGVFEQIFEFEEDVALGRNPLPREAADGEEQCQ